MNARIVRFLKWADYELELAGCGCSTVGCLALLLAGMFVYGIVLWSKGAFSR